MKQHTHTTHVTNRLRLVAAGTAIVSALALGACSSSNEKSSDQTAASEQTSATASENSQTEEANAENALELHEGYVKSKAADKDMTGVFGVLLNNTDKDIHIVKVSGSLDATYQIHEVVDGKMQEKKGGLVLKAHQPYLLAPGNDHLMIMDNGDNIAEGDTINLTLEDDQGNTYELKNIPARDKHSAASKAAEGAKNLGDAASDAAEQLSNNTQELLNEGADAMHQNHGSDTGGH